MPKYTSRDMTVSPFNYAKQKEVNTRVLFTNAVSRYTAAGQVYEVTPRLAVEIFTNFNSHNQKRF